MADYTVDPLICLACLDIPIIFESSASIKESLLCTQQWTRCNVQTLANQARNWLNWSAVEARYNEGPRDWQIVPTIRRFLFIKVVFHILYYFWGKEYHLLYWGFCCIEVLEIKVPLYFLVHHFHIDHNVPCLPPKILYSHCFQFFPGFYSHSTSNQRQWFCKIFGGKRGAYYDLCENGEYRSSLE